MIFISFFYLLFVFSQVFHNKKKYYLSEKGLPWWLSSKEPPANAGDVGSIPGLGRSPGKQNGNLFPYSCLWNPMDRGAWHATVHGGHKSVEHDLATKQQQQSWKKTVYFQVMHIYQISSPTPPQHGISTLNQDPRAGFWLYPSTPMTTPDFQEEGPQGSSTSDHSATSPSASIGVR